VLEASSGVPLRAASYSAHASPLRLSFDKRQQLGAAVSIVPSQDASEADRSRLLAFKDELPKLVESKSRNGYLYLRKSIFKARPPGRDLRI
jgi:hypothetical protein